MKEHWKERLCKDGVCDFKANYDFFVKWLLSKTASCFYITGLPETVDEFYIKSTLLMDGYICITDFNGKMYAVNGAPGGKPDEYYRPTVFTVANPLLGSKVVTDDQNGVIIYNTPLDAYISGGIFGLIHQTSTLLADNIVSINCCQINSRVVALLTADSDSQVIAAENTMRNIYAGKPYKVIRSDIVEKINVNPIAGANSGQVIAELVELHNYIIANYFQSIGIRANNVKKKAHVLQDEIDIQNEFLQISIYEILASWQRGFDKVNEMYGTDIQVQINPALLPELITESEPPTVEPPVDEHPTDEQAVDEHPTDEHPTDEQAVDEPTTAESIIEQENEISEIVDIINDEREVDDNEHTENSENSRLE